MKYEMVLENAAQLHALSHPIRQRILSVLLYKELTNKAIADSLGESPPKVHFHVRELLNAGIIQLTKEEVNGSIIEKYYTASARSFRLSPSLELAKIDEHLLYETTFHETYRILIESVAYHEGILPNAQIFQQTGRLSKQEIEKIDKHLSAINEILTASETEKHRDGEDKTCYSLSYFFHPAPAINTNRDSKL
ncbi:winged helix-turn-helix domain-containing protein [Planococcus lenghuensis]|uniref:HTH arsR-type domain-containing protein n=1 Tax=Planococcus lenghuensis TaxID=2213202 RepID=A0A1Q2KYN7_9BACL|nr:winged helix-turn-helix domain-containing protein [Planococcus lenghuensis]AQQ53214.1 hypothetical protein B0X71_09070 [Planococcus lenghuensis]